MDNFQFLQPAQVQCWQWFVVPVVPAPAPICRRKRPLSAFWKEALNCERRINLKKEKACANRLDNRLKRLQRVHCWNMNRGIRKEEKIQRQEVKESRHTFKVIRGKRKSALETCPLWNCPRKTKKRRFNRRYRTLASSRSSSRSSLLSNWSLRSRTPIRFGDSS